MSAEPKPAAESLVTAASSASVIRKAFDRVCRLLESLASELGNKLPKSVKPVQVTPEYIKLTTTKLSHVVTKYVLFVCQEASTTTIEEQTNILLNHLRDVIMALRSVAPTAGPTMKGSILQYGCTFLESLRRLLEDVKTHVLAYLNYQDQLKRNPAAVANQQPPSLDNNASLTQLTATVWAACDELAHVPLNNWTAVSQAVKKTTTTITDAARELDDVTVDETKDETLNEVDVEEGPEEDDDDVFDFQGSSLSKREYEWVPGAQSLANLASTTLLKVSDLLAKMQPPTPALAATLGVPFINRASTSAGGPGAAANSAGTDADADAEADAPHVNAPEEEKNLSLVTEESRAAIAKFEEGLEKVAEDSEYITSQVDKMISALYSPQSLQIAARSAYIIVTRLGSILEWVEARNTEGWFAAVHSAAARSKKKKAKAKKAKAGKATDDAAEPDTEGTTTASAGSAESKDGEASSSSSTIASGSIDGVVPASSPMAALLQVASSSAAGAKARAPWYLDPFIIPSLPPTPPDVEIAQDAPRPPTAHASWPWLDEARKQLFAAYTKEPSLVDLHVVYCAGENLYVDSDEEQEDSGIDYGDDEDGDDYDDDD